MKSNIINKLNKLISFLEDSTSMSSTDLNHLESAVDAILGTRKTATEKSLKPTQDIIYIWSDGACSGNPGPGGWGTIIEMDGRLMELSGGSRKTTNNIMEMLGALEGIKRTPPGSSIVLTSDSQYVVKGMTQWIHGWKKKGWKKADGKAVLNKDIWLELDEEASKRTIDWKWIKGHAGHPENERCDELAREAIPQ